jgi:UDP-N-acetylglucosamine/UDP-N-acetylgalactosamine 4-epimerase
VYKETVRILDNFSTGDRANLHAITDAEVVEGDVRTYHIVREAVDGVDFVLHQAALGSVPRSIKDPVTSNDVNVSGTLNVLHAARDAKVQRLIYASSSSIYGRNAVLPKREDMTPMPMSPYAVSKLAGEQYCAAFFDVYRFEAVALRYFNVFGPRQNPVSQYAAVIPKFIHQLLHGEAPTVNGDGTQSRDFTYVQNIVAANLAACVASGAEGKAFNIAAGARYSLLDLLAELRQIMRINLEPTFFPPRLGDVPHSFADVTMAKRVLGYEPSVGFREGLQLTVNAMQESESRHMTGSLG